MDEYFCVPTPQVVSMCFMIKAAAEVTLSWDSIQIDD